MLFISNDPSVLDGIAFALRLSFPGIEATGVYDKKALGRELDRGGYDVVITDYQLDWTHGPDVVRTLKERWPDCPIVLFSISATDELQRDLATLRIAGPGAELPQSLAMLSGTVRAALDRSELLRERRRAESALRESEARFRSVFESATDAIVLADEKGTIVSWNRGAAAMFGYETEEILGRPLVTLMPERYRRRHEEGMQHFKSSGEERVIGSTLELEGLRKDGSEFPIELAIGAWETGHGINFSGVIRDVTRRKRAEDAVRRSYQQLRALSARVAEAQESERTAIAREIHDELGGALTALCIDIAWVRKRLEADPAKQEKLLARLGAMGGIVESTLDRVRQISAELRPQLLDQLGLVAAIEWQAGEFESRTGIRCRVRASDVRLPRRVSTSLFRIVQECLTNVARHSGARSVDVRLGSERKGLVLRVQDDGAGISHEAAGSPASLGLLGIQERALLLGGRARVRGGDGGTRVTVTLPLEARAPSKTPRRGVPA
jgi:two-component system sensor kinase